MEHVFIDEYLSKAYTLLCKVLSADVWNYNSVYVLKYLVWSEFANKCHSTINDVFCL